MDNLTHTLAGAALGEAGLKKHSGLAMAALMIGANLPDLDVLAVPFGANLTFRRGWTHGPLALAVLPILLTAALVSWDRWQRGRGTRPEGRAPVRPLALLGISFVGVLSHPFLDWLNTYGIRVLAPFSERWYYGDTLFIIDPLVWLALGTGIFLSRRGARRTGRAATRPALGAVLAVAAYTALMMGGSTAARGIAAGEVVRVTGEVPERVMAGPVMLDPLRRQLVFDMGAEYRLGSLRWGPAPDVRIEPDPLPANMDHPAVRAGLARRDVQDFLYWSRFPYFVIEEDSRGTVVHLGDVRFGRRGGDWARVTYRAEESAPPASP